MNEPSPEYAALAHAWVAELRGGSRRTWAEFRAAASAPALPDGGVSRRVPGAANLEVVRRLADRDLPQFGKLADLLIATAGPGRGPVDIPLAWPGAETGFGTPGQEPEALPAEELLRICCGALATLLVRAPVSAEAPGRRFRPPWKRSFVALGAPGSAQLVRDVLGAHGLVDSGLRPTYVILAGPLQDLMAQRWAARVAAGSRVRWPRVWRMAMSRHGLPLGIDPVALADRLTADVGASRVRVVVADNPSETLHRVGEALGLHGLPDIAARAGAGPLATDLLRRLNPVLTLRLGEDGRSRVIDSAWSDLVADEPATALAPPVDAAAWAFSTGTRLAAALGSGRYAVHGDPGLVVPALRPGTPGRVDPTEVLDLALDALARAWIRDTGGVL